MLYTRGLKWIRLTQLEGSPITAETERWQRNQRLRKGETNNGASLKHKKTSTLREKDGRGYREAVPTFFFTHSCDFIYLIFKKKTNHSKLSIGKNKRFWGQKERRPGVLFLLGSQRALGRRLYCCIVSCTLIFLLCCFFLVTVLFVREIN